MEERSNAPILVGALVVALLVALWYFLSGPTEARVSGKVTLDGAPLAQAQVVFLPQGEKTIGPVLAPTDAQGKYTLIGPGGGGLPLGTYKVEVNKFALK